MIPFDFKLLAELKVITTVSSLYVLVDAVSVKVVLVVAPVYCPL